MQFFVIILIGVNLVTGQVDVLFDFDKFKNKINNLPDVSTRCLQDLQELSSNAESSFWNLFDATSKFPWSGLSTGSKSDWGNYEQCINIRHEYSEGKILGKYCLYGLNMLYETEVYSLALCMPSECSAADYKKLLNYSLIEDSLCTTKDDLTNYTNGEIAMIVVFIVFAVLVVTSTTYDVLLYKKQKKTSHLLYIAFSAFTNGRKILHTAKGNKEQIQVFNGMKSISMMWVIAFHAMGFWLQIIVIDSDSITHWFNKLRAFYIFSALLAVDGFFFMSGFLQAYGYLKQKSKPLMSQIKNIPNLIIHRYIRLTPAMAMVYFTYITVFRHLASGPFMKIFITHEVKACQKYWLSFFLYFQNYYNNDDLCLGHTWYLSVDMQLFIISPIILIPVATLLANKQKNFKFVMILLFCLNIFAILMPIVVTSMWKKRDQYDHMGHFRLSVYTIGIMMGVFMREAKDRPFLNNIKTKSVVNFIIWVIVLVVMTAIALIYQKVSNSGYSDEIVSVGHSLLRPVWCLGLCWIVYSSFHGYGGIINWILTRPTLQMTSKISYCMYLIHWLVLIHYLIKIKTKMWFDDYMALLNWCGFFMLTYVSAFIWCICFESPMMIIEKLIFGGGKISKNPTKNTSKNIENGSSEHRPQKEN